MFPALGEDGKVTVTAPLVVSTKILDHLQL